MHRCPSCDDFVTMVTCGQCGNATILLLILTPTYLCQNSFVAMIEINLLIILMFIIIMSIMSIMSIILMKDSGKKIASLLVAHGANLEYQDIALRSFCLV